MKAEKIGRLDPGKLHYMSVSFIDDAEFGRARLMSELAEYWLDRKLDIAGLGFNEPQPTLSPEELAKVPGAEVAMGGSVDKLKLEVCVRDGLRVLIKPDEDRYWSAQAGEIGEQYALLKSDHILNYESMLEDVVQKANSTDKGKAEVKAPEDGEGQDAELPKYESLDALRAAEKVEEEVVSEVPDVTVLRCESGKVYIMATKKEKLLPKYSQLGGFGTGAYIAASDPQPGVSWNVTTDKAICQVDESTLRTDANSISTMSLYKMLVTLEKTKRVSEHKLSYLEVKRKDDGDGDVDGFEVTVRAHNKYRPMKNPNGKEEKPSGKNVFSRCISEVENSQHLKVAFRWRFEKVGGNLKVQKPYVVTSHAIKLLKDHPTQARACSLPPCWFKDLLEHTQSPSKTQRVCHPSPSLKAAVTLTWQETQR